MPNTDAEQITPGGNPVCPTCGQWLNPGERHEHSTNERIAALLAKHEYATTLRSGAICVCGFVPTVDPQSLQSQQDYHRAHLVAVLTAAGVGFVAEAIAEQEAEYPHFRGFVQKQWDEQVARAERAEAALERVRALAERWQGVINECKEADPRWILDQSVMALITAHRDLRAALDAAGVGFVAEAEGEWMSATPEQWKKRVMKALDLATDAQNRAERAEAALADLRAEYERVVNGFRGLRVRVKALADDLRREADALCPVGEYDKADKAWRAATVRRRCADTLRALLDTEADQ